MKLNTRKIALALVLTATTGLSNAAVSSNMESDLILNDAVLFNNDVVANITDHHKIDLNTVAHLVEAPTRSLLKTKLGESKNISNNESGETWFYGLEIPTNPTNNEKCVVAFVFDNKNSDSADIVSFDKTACETVVAQKLELQ